MSAPPDNKRVIRALTGCTGVGKTEWALRWAEERGAEIISCDSLLFYREMSIGTAKPTASELQRVPHHLIDCCDVTEQMDVGRFVGLARAALAGIAERGREALIVGGSGFYLKAFFAPVTDDVEVSPELREEVAALTAEEALQRLRQLNPDGLGQLDTENPRRVTRALERCLASGRSILSLAEAFARQASPFADFEVILTRIDRTPEELEPRLVMRVEQMLRVGLVDEVRDLIGRGLKDNQSAARAIGYREVIEVLEGRLSPDALLDEIVKNTRGLVKKQRTWFRTQLPTHHVISATELRQTGDLFVR
ncbi:MAG: tRNA (adenosine(37)-N6)-dimethylallyltransferase MiaA [Opitutus sp.]